ncbi:transcription-repair coupling factor (superfamily II helicase) [Brevundimonas nasdae]|uniref:transcription-repair coupling factor n=1 Tax=Brevundimonas nasdae TaxID=172043 RepID=UPI001911E6AF|nr:transcription-repair coupling factor [Brevundimonas nasdae]MBK6024208.1 transcription-repair coupling factor [Brevundimonas nasdae]MDQ0450863.1 transcription-repair coupling factor (superfamily II helicase) [Brevundimonas nasdae]
MDAQVHRTDAELGGAPEGLDALIVAERVKASGGVGLFVARDYQRSGAFVQAFQFFTQDIEVLEYPAWDCLPYDRLSPTAGIAAQRMATLTRLAQRKPDDAPVLVVTTVSAAMQRTPPRSVTTLAGFDAKVGRDLDIQALERYFAANGYVRASTVSERGEFAVRGGVVDVFPPGFAEPVRLDMFGSELESIRTFDPETQRSTGQMKAVALAPVSEALLDKEAISRFRTGYLNLFGAPGDDPLYATISEGARRQGMEQWLPLFYDGLDTLFDYLPDQAQVFLDNQVETARSERWDLVADAYEARAEAAKTKGGASANRALPPKRLYLEEGDWNQALAGRAVRRFTPFSSGGEDAGGRLGRTFGAERAQDSVNLFEAVAAHAQTLKSEGKRVLFASWTEGSSDRLATMLADHGLDHIVAVRDWDDVQNAPKDIYLRGVLPVEHGFVTDDVAVICETDILGDRLARPRKKRRASNFLAEASALTTGDLVVHLDHGIGRYEGLKTLDIQQAPHDCLELLYAGESKLYLPVENIDLLTRYGSDSEGAQLDRLGGAGWQARKAKAKERLRAMAEGLIALAAKRALRETEAVVPPSGLFAEFCARFPYEETDDQLNAIGDVLEDLGKGTPMDRLICGDVGFGKTEVALRAAFVVAMTGQQVAIVAPTTLLARQHFKTFTERFAGWPVKVRQLSRMVGSKEAAETRQGLKDGSVEIVVGTHAVLSEQVGFRDLGLVIVDEEQHFGVKHKEKLKTLRADVHLLTLTATPIPRTLQMALSGIREMSIIATPPVDRLAVRTYVTPWDPVLVREALLREKYRGGQAYYVAPRLKDLPDIEKFLREQVPEVKFVVGHGQMSATQLEEVMSAFYDGEYDVLVSTTIVESGLDIPTANTLVVHRADMFGLAQLYQIRGRVGRSKARAFAYLTTDAVKPMTLSAERRLQVLQSLDNLGAGFQLASHDLDQRGGGNLLGDEQSGHIREVGVELYQQMLEDAVAELRENGEPGAVDRGWSPSINVGASVLIPENYVPDLNVRLSLYRRLSDAEQAEDREALAAELIDRFGPLPDEAQQLLKIVGIKANCRKACIEKIDIGPRGAVLTLRDNSFPNPVGLVGLIQKNQAFWKIRPDQKIVVSGDWPTAEDRLKVAEGITADLARVAGA